MWSRAFTALVWISLAALPSLAAAESASELADIAARIDYAFYSERPRILDGARDALARMKPDDPAVAYWTAYVALREAELQRHGDAAAGHLLDDCVARAERAGADAKWAAEAAILVAACSNLAARRKPLPRLLHERRRERALERARRLAANNPRLALVEAWAAAENPEHAAAAVQRELIVKLDKALARFTAQDSPPGAPDWGEADAWACLGALYLARGETRRARDAVERALLQASDYAYALRLRARLAAFR